METCGYLLNLYRCSVHRVSAFASFSELESFGTNTISQFEFQRKKMYAYDERNNNNKLMWMHFSEFTCSSKTSDEWLTALNTETIKGAFSSFISYDRPLYEWMNLFMKLWKFEIQWINLNAKLVRHLQHSNFPVIFIQRETRLDHFLLRMQAKEVALILCALFSVKKSFCCCWFKFLN